MAIWSGTRSSIVSIHLKSQFITTIKILREEEIKFPEYLPVKSSIREAMENIE